MKKENGWKPIPLSLKIIFVIFILWSIGSILGISTRFELGLPFFGVFVYGIIAILIVLILDIIAPLTFLFAMWNRKVWGARFALTYITIFILNSVVAIFAFREQLGLQQIMIPLTVNIIFFIIIFRTRNYFT